MVEPTDYTVGSLCGVAFLASLAFCAHEITEVGGSMPGAIFAGTVLCAAIIVGTFYLFY